MTQPIVPGLTSLIVPCLGRLEPTQRCITAILRHTRRPVELIAVTRRGEGPIGTYLSGVRDTAGTRDRDRLRIEIVAEPGLKRDHSAWHRGLPLARGEHVALLKRRAVVTDGWLDMLIALADADASHGMVSAMSNAASGLQFADGSSSVGSAADLDAIAARWRAERRGRWFTTEALSGPCLLLKRGVIEVAGLKQGPAGGLTPRRLSERVRSAGFRLAVANDLYVHREPGQRPTAPAATATPTVSAPAPKRACRVSLTMIVRNEEANLPACLESAAGLFDEIVVVDTGSTDRTVEIARSFGARVFDFVWVDDFAAARNAALARATGDYAFWLDADDRLEPPERDRLLALLDGLRPGDAPSAYVIRCACDPSPEGGGTTVVDHIRLFPVREDVRWSYRVHEQILPALRRAGVGVRWTDVVVRHVGYVDAALRRKKLARDRAILDSEVAERPGDPFVLFNLGQVALETGDTRAALDYLKRSLSASTAGDSIVRKLHALIARAHQSLGEVPQALAACAAGLAAEPDDPELLFRKGVLHRLKGEAAEAGECWRRVLKLNPGGRQPERFASVDQGIFGYATHRNLAILADEQGDRAGAALHWSSVLAERPGDAEASRALARLGRAPAAAGRPMP